MSGYIVERGPVYVGILIAEQHGFHILVVCHVFQGKEVTWLEATQVDADSAGFGDESR